MNYFIWVIMCSIVVLSSWGLSAHQVAFMTCHRRKPMVVVLPPRYSLTTHGLFSKTVVITSVTLIERSWWRVNWWILLSIVVSPCINVSNNGLAIASGVPELFSISKNLINHVLSSWIADSQYELIKVVTEPMSHFAMSLGSSLWSIHSWNHSKSRSLLSSQ